MRALRLAKVGGTYWAARPELPSKFVLVRSQASVELAKKVAPACEVVLWVPGGEEGAARSSATVITGDCDPWHMVESAAAVVTQCGDEIRPIAAMLGVTTYLHEDSSDGLILDSTPAEELLAPEFAGLSYDNPFTGQEMSVIEAIDLCGFWRQLIDSNRDIAGGLGFAFWKQNHVSPLLWNGTSAITFSRDADGLSHRSAVAIWRTKASPEVVARLEGDGSRLIEVEDGFLRSRGLGADCIPPLSITVDRLGAYFDPTGPSELEQLLESADFDHALVERARLLRELIVTAGIGKYEQGGAAVERREPGRVHILVPGQVEDDRAVQLGGCGLTSNLDLLKKVRESAPQAYILYKPHPDVLAGHRRGAIIDELCLQYADEVCGEAPIASLIAMVDEVHVNTSLAGFEALLRQKQVTTYGVPFYAGWGLTRDLGPVPSRRTTRRSVDELVAATLLLYPRYLDPLTGLPCPAEIVVERLLNADGGHVNFLVSVRRLQGRVMRRIRNLVQ